MVISLILVSSNNIVIIISNFWLTSLPMLVILARVNIVAMGIIKGLVVKDTFLVVLAYVHSLLA
jgi:hypothetical protein